MPRNRTSDSTRSQRRDERRAEIARASGLQSTAAASSFAAIRVVPRRSTAGVTTPDSGIPVRRPIFGLSRFPPGMEAKLTVLEEDGTPVPMLNSSSASGTFEGTANFFVTQWVRSSGDQGPTLTRTFSGYHLSMNSKGPPTYQITLSMPDTYNFPWVTEWLQNFDAVTGAMSTIPRRRMIQVEIDNRIFTGTMIDPSVASMGAEVWGMYQVAFGLIVDSERPADAMDVASAAARGRSSVLDFYAQESSNLPFEISVIDAITGEADTRARLVMSSETISGTGSGGFFGIELQLDREVSPGGDIIPPDVEGALRLAAGANRRLGRNAYSLNQTRRGVLARAAGDILDWAGSSHPLGSYFTGTAPNEIDAFLRGARVRETTLDSAIVSVAAAFGGTVYGRTVGARARPQAPSTSAAGARAGDTVRTVIS